MASAAPKQANERLKAILRAGRLFEGKYRILRPLGAGSFAVVVHARHEVMGRDVALKFLKPKMVAANPEVSERFIKEVQIASKLAHPNIVSIYDFGLTEDGIHYMVQEFVDGKTFDALISPEAPLAPHRALEVMRQVLDCLGEAHGQGVIHRDLKPSNLMATRDEADRELVKILDFGVAKLLEEPAGAGQPVRQSTKFIGTPIYMSPEQILGRAVGPASDLYSAGLMFYEMLTGAPPIEADQIAEVVQTHLSAEPIAFSRIDRIEARLARVIERATRREPGERFASAAEFLRALDGRLEEPAAARPQPAAAPAAELGATSSEQVMDAFSGRNYIGPADDDGFIRAAETPEPLVFKAPAPLRAPVEAPRAPAPAAPQASSSAELELDMDAMREVRVRRQRAAPREGARPVEPAPSRVIPRASRAPSGRVAWASVARGALAAIVLALASLTSFIALSAVTSGLPGAGRVLAGLTPLVLAAGWVVVDAKLRRAAVARGSWLGALALRAVILAVCVLGLLAIVMPERAESALQYEALWWTRGEGAGPTGLARIVEPAAGSLARLYGAIAAD